MVRAAAIVIHALATAGCLLLGGDDGNARIRGYDALALPGERVVVTAKLETRGPPGLAPDLRDVSLRFLLPWGGVAEGRTDGDGKAGVRVLLPREPADHVVGVQLAPGSPWTARPAALLIRVRAADEPFLVVDLDGTVTGASAAEVAFGDPEPCPDASRVLADLARERSILYLTARDDALLERSRRFLDEHGFPAGPVLTADLRLGRLSAERYKREALAALRRRFRGDWVGIGDRPEDARAYLSAGVGALIVVPEGEGEALPARAVRVKGWREVRRRIPPVRVEPGRPEAGS